MGSSQFNNKNNTKIMNKHYNDLTIFGDLTVTGSTTTSQQFNGGVNIDLNQLAEFTVNNENITTSAYTFDLSISNINSYSATTNSALSYSAASVGTYVFIIDNTGSHTITLATGGGWYVSGGEQPDFTDIVLMTGIYDGSRMFISSIESMEEIV
jgi:hypothetical protein